MVDISNYPYHFETDAHHHSFVVDRIFTGNHFSDWNNCNFRFGINKGVVG